MRIDDVRTGWGATCGASLFCFGLSCSSPSGGAGSDASAANTDGAPDTAAPSPDGAAAVDASDAGGLDGPVPTEAGYPAAHASLPRVQTLGGPVLTSPNIVPVFFAGDPMQAPIEQFLSQLGGSSYWSAATSEYGVGPARVAPSIVVADAVPTALGPRQVVSWLAGYLDGTHPEWPAVALNNVYVVFYPAATTITESSGKTSCVDFGGYHSEGNTSAAGGSAGGDGGTGSDAAAAGGDGGTGSDAAAAGGDGGTGSDAAALDVAGNQGGGSVGVEAGAAPGQPFVLVVIPRCTMFNTLSGIDSLTAALSHELVEAATNPLTNTNRAYTLVDFDHLAWALGGSTRDPFVDEVGDMCQSESPDRINQRLVGTFMVQRTWSNQAAAAALDPCVPAIPGAYVGAAPDFDELDTIRNSDGGTPNVLITTGAKIAVGQSKTIKIRLFSTAPTPDWYVTPYQVVAGSGAATSLKTALDKSSGNNGDILQLTLTRTANGPTSGGTVIILVSSPTPPPLPKLPSSFDAWYGFVEN